MPRRTIIIVFVSVAAIATALTVVDLLRETDTLTFADVLINFADELILLGGMAAVAWTVQRVGDLKEEQAALSNNLSRAMAQGDQWRAERQAEIAALGSAIADQFRQWQLTAAEIDIAGLMLKGASLKEIAIARYTSEATIRQQAQSIYRKAGLSGRAELSAYFLESLFTTAEETRRPGLTLVSSAPKAR